MLLQVLDKGPSHDEVMINQALTRIKQFGGTYLLAAVSGHVLSRYSVNQQQTLQRTAHTV